MISQHLSFEAWLRQAQQFVVAAEVLIAELNPPRRSRTEEANIKAVGCLRSALLLPAIAVENSLKAIKVAQGQVVVIDGKVERRSLGGGNGGHQLVVLAREARFSLSEAEESLLNRLTEIVVWAGRYQQPLSVKEFKEASENNPRRLSPVADIRLVRELLTRAALQARTARESVSRGLPSG